MFQTDKYGACLFDAILRSLHTDHLQFRRQYNLHDLRRMLVVLMAEYWHLIVDEQFLLTIQMEYAEDEEERAIREKRGLSWPPRPYSLRTYLRAMLRPTMWGDGNVVAAVSRLFGLRISVIQGQVGDCTVVPIRHCRPLQKVDIVLIYNGGSHYTACCKLFNLMKYILSEKKK